jgi:hypothetical protein
MADDAPRKKKKSKPMSTTLKRFLKKHGRFPKKGELKRASRRKSGKKKSKRRADKRTKRSVRGKKDYVFTKARRAALAKIQRGNRRGGKRKKSSKKSRSRKGIRRASRGGISLG